MMTETIIIKYFITFLILSGAFLAESKVAGVNYVTTDFDGNFAGQFDDSVNLVIKVFTCDRPDSLRRLLISLSSAYYYGCKVDLDIFIDSPPILYDRRSKINHRKESKHEALHLKEKVIKICTMFEWRHGQKSIHERVFNTGVLGQWTEAWYPSNTKQYALMLEDDVEVSPYYYVWLRRGIYHYDKPSNPELKNIFGITMQRLGYYFSLQKNKGKLPLNTGNKPFAYPILGTWGQLFFPSAWMEFREWFRRSYSNPNYEPLVDGIINTQWYMKIGDKAWEQWVIKWAHENGKYCIYSNFPNGTCVSTNHREQGNNFRKLIGPDCLLLSHEVPELAYFDERPKFFDVSLTEIEPV